MEDLKESGKRLANRYVVDDLRENENSQTNLWDEFCYLKMKKEGSTAEDKAAYADEHYEMPVWVDYKRVR